MFRFGLDRERTTHSTSDRALAIGSHRRKSRSTSGGTTTPGRNKRRADLPGDGRHARPVSSGSSTSDSVFRGHPDCLLKVAEPLKDAPDPDPTRPRRSGNSAGVTATTKPRFRSGLRPADRPALQPRPELPRPVRHPFVDDHRESRHALHLNSQARRRRGARERSGRIPCEKAGGEVRFIQRYWDKPCPPPSLSILVQPSRDPGRR